MAGEEKPREDINLSAGLCEPKFFTEAAQVSEPACSLRLREYKMSILKALNNIGSS